MKKILSYLFLLFCLYISTAPSAYTANFLEQDSDTVPLTDSTFSQSKNHSLFMGTGYGSDLLYAGTSLTANQNYFSADFIYTYKGNLWGSMSVYNLPGYSSAIQLIDFSAGFSYVFNKYFDASTSISYYHSNSELKQEYWDDFAFIRLSGGFDWFWIYSKLTLGKILEKESGFYLYFRNSRYFRTPVFGKHNSYFSFDPNVNILFGNYTQLTRYRIPGTRPGVRPGRPEQIDYYVEAEDIFTLLQAEFSLPVTFYFHNLSVEIEPLYLIPANKIPFSNQARGFYFFLNLYYRMF